MTELMGYSDGEIKTMVHQVSNPILVAALRDAPPEVLAKVQKHFTRRATDLFNDALKEFRVQCLSERDIKAAQAIILAILAWGDPLKWWTDDRQ